MWLRSLGYFTREALVSCHQDRRLYSITIVMIGLSLMILSMFLLVIYNTHLVLRDLGKQFKIVVFLEDHITLEQRQIILGHLQNFAGPQTVQYVSKDQALRDFTSWFPEGQHLLTGLSHNPLPASYVVPLTPQTHDSLAIRKLVERLSHASGVEEVDSGTQWHQGFRTLVHVAQLLSITGGALLGLGIIFIVANTIRLTIYMRLDEIEIMQLVGATEGFIKGPFLLSGMAQGGGGALLALVLLYGVYALYLRHLGHLLETTLGLHQLSFLPLFLLVGVLVSGVILGYIGSVFALSRALRTIDPARK